MAKDTSSEQTEADETAGEDELQVGTDTVADTEAEQAEDAQPEILYDEYGSVIQFPELSHPLQRATPLEETLTYSEPDEK